MPILVAELQRELVVLHHQGVIDSGAKDWSLGLLANITMFPDQLTRNEDVMLGKENPALAHRHSNSHSTTMLVFIRRVHLAMPRRSLRLLQHWPLCAHSPAGSNLRKIALT